jgi:hypothetical protein
MRHIAETEEHRAQRERYTAELRERFANPEKTREGAIEELIALMDGVE